MSTCRMPDWKYNPLYKKMYEMGKKKHLEWAKRHGCYEEVKRYYEMQELLMKIIVF